jgi:hypothetical protein
VVGILTRLEKDYQDGDADSKNEWNSMREDIRNKVIYIYIIE